MKSEEIRFFAGLFGGKGGGGGVQETSSSEVLTTSSAQPHVLREKMKEKELTHGETVTVNMSPVRLEAAFGKRYVYFCPMQTLEIVNTITPGDGGDIPYEVVLDGLSVPAGYAPGLYTLKNVRLTSNGTMQLTANAETTWEAVG